MRRSRDKTKTNKSKKLVIRICIAAVLAIVFSAIIFLFVQFSKFQFLTDIFSRLKAPKKINLNLRNIYSDKIKQNLVSFVSTSTTKYAANFDPDLFYKSLKKKFKSIKKIEWAFGEGDHANLSVVGVTPFCLINDKFVLCNKRRLFTKEIFEKFNLNRLNQVDFDESFMGEKLDSDLYSFLQKVPQDKFDKFKISYCSNDEINLIPKKSKTSNVSSELNYLLKFDRNSFDDEAKFAATDFVLKDFKNRHRNKTKVLDFRFKGRIYAKNINLDYQNKTGG